MQLMKEGPAHSLCEEGALSYIKRVTEHDLEASSKQPSSSVPSSIPSPGPYLGSYPNFPQ